MEGAARRLQFQIEATDQGETVWNYLTRKKGFTKMQVKRMKFQPGGICIDQKQVRVTHVLAAGERLEVSLEAPKRKKGKLQAESEMNSGMMPADTLMKADFDSGLYADMFEYLSSGMKARDFIGEIPEEQSREALEAINFEPLPENKEKAMSLAEELLHRIRQIRINQQINLYAARAKTADAEERKRLNQQIQALLAKLD